MTVSGALAAGAAWLLRAAVTAAPCGAAVRGGQMADRARGHLRDLR